MFNKASLSKEITPKRVFALLKFIAYKNGICTSQEVCNYIQPIHLNKSQSEVSRTIKFVIDEELIKEDFDKKLHLNFSKDFLVDESKFRKFMNINLFENVNRNSFYEITKTMLTQDIEIYDVTGFESIGLRLATNESRKDSMLAWRFWASFLGFGFILNSQFVLNPYIRFRDIIEEKFNGRFNEPIMLEDFFLQFKSYCPEIEDSIKNNELSLPISLALMTLNDLNCISLTEIRDSEDIWKLNLSDSIKLVTHIELLGGNINE